LAACLGALKRKVLLVDLDPQGNATTGLGINKAEVKTSIYDILLDEEDTKKAILKTDFKNLSIVPATINLAGVDIELIEKARLDPGFNKTGQLKKRLELVKDNYDYILVDCPPSLGILTTNALSAADSIIIPLQCEFFPLEGIMQLLNTIRLAQKSLNTELKIEGVLLTMFDARTNLGLEVVEDAKNYFKEKVYDTIIPRLVKLSEAPSHGKPIYVYDPHSRGTDAYFNLAKEVIDRNGK
jgi:chromosome partitioning protein